MIELTANQLSAISAVGRGPAQMVDPTTGEVFVLIKKDVYDLTCKIVGGGKGQVWDDEADDDLIAPRINVRERT